MSKTRHITLPAGFRAAGVRCGIKASGAEDLAVVAADRDAAAAIMTTRNQVVGAPVIWCRSVLPRGCGRARAIVINSGCSNVCTGKRGLKDAEAMAAETARPLGTRPRKVLVASTGVIGHRLPMARIRKGISAAVAALGTRNDSSALRAIMTTDTQEKSAVARARLGRRLVTVAGMAKGSGMIAPSLATMIAVLTTDAAVSPPALHKALKAAAAGSFNAVTVDSDTSTSDTVAFLASGAAGNRALTAKSAGFGGFAAAVNQVCRELAWAIAADGEGATKVIEVVVRGARSAAEGEAAAKSVANSPLLKCAVHGCDPNWGRILAALGKSPARIDPQKVSVRIGSQTVFSRGTGRNFDRKRLAWYLAGKAVRIACDLGLGRGRYTALTCDLSREYVAINAEYHT